MDLSIIIPLHEYNDDVKKMLERAIASTPKNFEVRISCPYGLSSELEKLNTSDNVVVMEGKEGEGSDFCTLVNQAVGGTKWFSVLEYDDEYTDIWFKNVETYMEYNPEVSVFLPLEDLIDYNENRFIGFGNEAPWASSFSNEIGFVDNDCLQNFFDFYMTGSVFNTDDWKAIGGLKPSIKLAFWYEFLLRMTNKDKKIFVIPKVGYKHLVNRKNSLFDIYRNTMDAKESQWWFDLAKKDYIHLNERESKYYVYNAENNEDSSKGE